MENYSKHDFYRMVYEKNGGRYPLEDVTWIVKYVFACMDDIIMSGDKLTIYGYFSLQRALKLERITGNFGKPCKIPKRYELELKPSVRLKRICKEMEVEEEFDED